VVRNNTDQPVIGAIISWVENNHVRHSQTQDFGPGEAVEVRWNWPGADGPGVSRAEVRAEPPADLSDSNEEDNRRWDYINARQPTAARVSCAETRERGNWEVTYAVIVGYNTRETTWTWTLPSGETQTSTESYTDYSSPIYAYYDVGYSESLSAAVTLHTGQGRLPDPARPAAEDQDGRGAWEIIPYARAKGLDPNQVTRAGAGFTLRVETNYSTDWETKVPAGAEAIGGILTGPDQVTAEFYDTRGTVVRTLALEKTEGGDTGRAIWQLPLASHTYQDGAGARKRWFYTAPDIPDGDYQVLVRVSGAGMQGLHTCKVAKARIYGSIYDDIYEGIKGSR
jgi:hypothetical protein